MLYAVCLVRGLAHLRPVCSVQAGGWAGFRPRKRSELGKGSCLLSWGRRRAWS